MKILIIDDSKTFHAYLKQLISDLEEIDTLYLTDPRQVIAKSESYRPDIVLTDLEMPHLSGIEICKILRAHPIFSTTPIILLTSTNEDLKIVEAIKAGANDYVLKNASKEIIVQKIINLLKYKKLLDQNIQDKQFEAIRSLITTSNHEFNNALMISNGFLMKLKQKANPEQLILIEKLSQANERIEAIVKKLDSISTIENSEYAINSKMLKI